MSLHLLVWNNSGRGSERWGLRISDNSYCHKTLLWASYFLSTSFRSYEQRSLIALFSYLRLKRTLCLSGADYMSNQFHLPKRTKEDFRALEDLGCNFSTFEDNTCILAPTSSKE